MAAVNLKSQAQPKGVGRPHRVWTPLVTQAFSSVGSVHAVRHCRVFGLSLRQVTRRGPSWRCADRIHIAYASLMALRCAYGRSTVTGCHDGARTVWRTMPGLGENDAIMPPLYCSQGGRFDSASSAGHSKAGVTR